MQIQLGSEINYQFILNSGRSYTVVCNHDSTAPCAAPVAVQPTSSSTRFIQQRALNAIAQVQNYDVIVAVTVNFAFSIP